MPLRPASWFRLTVAAVVVLGLVGHPAVAKAKPMEDVEEEHPGHHHARFPNVLGVRAGFLSVFDPGPDERGLYPGFLAGISYERTLVHEWLELEISVPVAIVTGEETVVGLPIDLHLKKPFHPSPRFSPYVALGPAFDIEVRPQRRLAVGGSLAAGTYVWLSSQVGFDVELDYNLVALEGRPIHGAFVAAGMVFRL